jgi:phytoene dehydrogenase-like protein
MVMHDVVINGGGHNGLVCSAYLAMAGFKVMVLDQRSVVGGAAVTEEFSPIFFNSVASYAVSLLNPKIIRDLDLAAHGLRRWTERKASGAMRSEACAPSPKAKAAAAHGVDIRLSTRVRQVLVQNGRAVGVETDKGETISAAAVAAGINPKLLNLHLVDSCALPEEFRRRIEKWRCGSGTFRMNVAPSELPDFTTLPGRAPAEHHASGIIIAPSLAYMERAYFDARSFGWSRRPIVELVIPSTIDDTLAHPAAAVILSRQTKRRML